MAPVFTSDKYIPENIAIAVMTVNRSPQYIHQTLASLFASDALIHQVDPVWLMVGSQDCDYLNNYFHHKHLRVTPISEKEAIAISDWKIWRKFNHNYVRCLSLPLDDKIGILVIEDDVVLRDRFLEILLCTLREIEQVAELGEYALALFASDDFERDQSFYRGQLYCSYGWEYRGTQCMYYPKATAKWLATQIKAHGVDEFEAPGDMLVKRFCKNMIYSCNRALAQHVGAESTGVGNGLKGVWQTPRFSRPFELISKRQWGKRLEAESHLPIADQDLLCK